MRVRICLSVRFTLAPSFRRVLLGALVSLAALVFDAHLPLPICAPAGGSLYALGEVPRTR